MSVTAVCLKSIEDWKAFNRTCQEHCGDFLIIGADMIEETGLWFGLITLIPESGKPEYYTTEAIYPNRDEAFHKALCGTQKWTNDLVGWFEGGCVVPPEEMGRP